MNSELSQPPRHFSSTLAPLEEAVLAVFDGRIVEVISTGAAFSRIRCVENGEVTTVTTGALCLCEGQAIPEGSPPISAQSGISHGAGIPPLTDTGKSKFPVD